MAFNFATVQWTTGCVIACFGMGVEAAIAQRAITPDTTLGNESSRIEIQNDRALIVDGAQRGTNLFHSFERFGVRDSEQVYFAPNPSIENILTRVTGERRSRIDGTLGIEDSSASLFLLNPNGIIFGEDAVLDLSGSFIASSADSFLFESGIEFSSKSPETLPLLTLKSPIGLQYGDDPGSIRASSIFELGEMQTFALAGGDVRLDEAELITQGGDIQIGGFSGQDIEISYDDNGPSLNLVGSNPNEDIRIIDSILEDITGVGSIEIYGGSVDIDFSDLYTVSTDSPSGDIKIIASGEAEIIDSELETNNSGSFNSGKIEVDAANAVLEGSLLSTSSASASSGNIDLDIKGELNIIDTELLTYIDAPEADSVSGDIIINSGPLKIIGLDLDSEVDQGVSGDFLINSSNSVLIQNSLISSEGFDEGLPGNISIIAEEDITVEETDFLLAKDKGQENGNFNASARNINLRSNTDIDTAIFEEGKSGNVSIKAREKFLLSDNSSISVNINEAARKSGGGDISISSDSIRFANGSSLNSSIKGDGEGGIIFLNASSDIEFLNSFIANQVLTADDSNGLGIAGNTFINASGAMKMENSVIFGDISPNSIGKSGDLNIRAGALNLQNSALINGTNGSGKIGDISLEVNGDIVIFDGGIYSNVASLSLNGDGGAGGELSISAKNISILNGAQVFLSTEGRGDAGSMVIEAQNQILISGTRQSGRSSSLYSSSESQAIGSAGNITVRSPRIILDDKGIISTRTANSSTGGNIIVSSKILEMNGGGQIISSTLSEGQAGNISIEAQDQISISGYDTDYKRRIRTSAPINIDTQGKYSGLYSDSEVRDVNVTESANNKSSNITGNAGNIDIRTPYLKVSEGGKVVVSTRGTGNSGNIDIQAISEQLRLDINNSAENIDSSSEISAETQSSGNGGDITLIAPESIEISGNGLLNAQTSATGSAGNFSIKTRQLTIDEGTTLSTTATRTANPPANEDGSSANINLRADEMNLFGTVQVLSETQGNAQAGKLTLQPNAGENLEINLRENSKVSASTSGNGKGGQLVLTAPNKLTISGQGRLSAETTGGLGKGGEVQVRAGQFILENQAKLSTSTSGLGDGGNINVDVDGQVIVRDDAQISVSSTAQGNGGDINVRSGSGLLLRRNGVIETDAQFDQGNGGNIFIATPFLFGFTGENGDIIANARSGDGGRIEINAQNIFGFELKDGQNRDQLRSNVSNDISASSESGTSGTIALNTINTDPSRGLSELPIRLVDPSSLIDRRCELIANPNSTSRFVQRNNRGLPTDPSQILQDQLFLEDLATIVAETTEENPGLGELSPPEQPARQSESQQLYSQQLNSQQLSSQQLNSKQPPITEAQNWHFSSTGETQLVAAQATRASPKTAPCSTDEASS